MMAANPSVLIVCSFFIQVASEYLFGPGQVTGSLGGSVIVPCYYSPISANIHGRKFWCKMRGSQCNTIISTSPYVEQNYMNRTYLEDVRDHFMVNMTGLQYKDAGAYRCGIGNNNNMLYYPVSMTISEGKNIPSSSEVYIRKLRGSLDIRCPAPRMLSNGSLYLCKVTKSASCDTIINNSGQVNSRFWGRVLIQEERNKTGFNVLVNELGRTDSGFYRCGVSSHTNESVWKDVHVLVIDESTRKKVLKPPTAGESLQAKCQVPKDFGPRTLTYWCKWSPAGCPPLVDSNGFIREGLESRISLIPDDSTVRQYTVIMKHLEVEDSGSYWCITSNGSRVESSSIIVDVLALTTKAYLSYTGSPDVTSIGTHSTDLLPTTEINTIRSSSTDSVTVPPIYNRSSSAPPSSRVTLQDTTAALYSQSSTRGQSSTQIGTVPSNPRGSTVSRQGHSPPAVLGPTSRPAVSSSSSAAVSRVPGTNPSRSSGTHAASRSGTTLAPRRTSGTTQRTGSSTLYSQPVSGKNESSSESLVFRRKNLLLVIIPVVVIACCIIIGALVAVFVKVQKINAGNDPTANQEHVAMIDKEAKLQDAQYIDIHVLKLDNPEALCGTTDV